MSVHPIMIRPHTMTGVGKITRLAVFLGIGLGSGLITMLSYATGNVIFFLSLLIFILLGFKRYQGRNLLLLLYAHLLVAVATVNIASSMPAVRQLVVGSGAGVSSQDQLSVFSLAVLLGVVASILLVTVPFLLTAATAAAIVAKWHVGEDEAFKSAFIHTIYSLLAVIHSVVVVEAGELQGSAENIERLEQFGGPCWLTVHSGQVVVLHIQGRITRAVGLGTVMVQRGEKIKAVLPLGPEGNVQEIENVLTRDRIPLKVKVLHAARLEPAADTQARLEGVVVAAQAKLHQLTRHGGTVEQIEAARQALEAARRELLALDGDKLVGDEIFQIYESTAKLAALRGPKPYEAVKFAIVNNTKDAFMAEYAEDLFKIHAGDGADLDSRIDQRKIKEIEDMVTKKSLAFGLGKGAKLLIVDIADIVFPDELKDKIEQEVKTQIEERIKETEVRIAESKARADMTLARAKAQASILEGKSEGEARAALFREILRELKREQLPQEQIAGAMLNLIAATTSVKEVKDLFKSATVLGRRFSDLTPEQLTNGAGD